MSIKSCVLFLMLASLVLMSLPHLMSGARGGIGKNRIMIMYCLFDFDLGKSISSNCHGDFHIQAIYYSW